MEFTNWNVWYNELQYGGFDTNKIGNDLLVAITLLSSSYAEYDLRS